MVQASFPAVIKVFPRAVDVELGVEPELKAGNKRDFM